MKKLLLASVILFFSASGILADTLNSGASLATSTAFNPTGSFWNNISDDVVNGTNTANVGNFLNDSGGFALNGNVTPGCSTCGVNYMASGGQMYVNSGNTPDFVSNLNFVKQTGGIQLTLLYANNAENSITSFGIYDASSVANSVNHVVLQQAGIVNLNNSIGTTYTSGTQFAGATNLGSISLASGSPYADWGIYVTTCTQSAITCPTGDVVTYFMGQPSALNPGQTPFDTGHEHFALFQAGTNVNQYYAGVEETAFNAGSPHGGVDGYGDYNDLIFGVSTGLSVVTPPPPMPEPNTLPLLALGVMGVGLIARRR